MLDAFPHTRRAFLFARLIVNVCLGLLLLLWPGAGPYRFMLAALLIFVFSPAAVFVELRYPSEHHPWALPFVDTLAVVVLSHLVPEFWMSSFAVGLLVTSSAAVAAPGDSFHYLGLQALLLGGLTVCAVIHGVSGWGMPVLTVALCAPSASFYLRWEASRAEARRDHQKQLETVALFAGGVAHDFNNLLTSIVANADLALLEIPALGAGRARVEQLLRATARAKLLTAQFQALSAEAMTPIALDLAAEASELVALLADVVPANVQLSVRIDGEVPGIVGDPAQLQQVLMNLIINGAEACAPGGGEVTLTLRHAGAWAVLAVRDTGRGMSAEVLGRIFEPFASSKGPGRGLGLCTVPGVLARHQGSVEVDSVQGEGTTFTLCLPVRPSPTGQPSPDPAATGLGPASARSPARDPVSV